MRKHEITPAPKFNLIYFLIAVWLLIFVFDFLQYRKHVEALPYSEFISDVGQGKIDELAIGKDRIDGIFKSAPPGHSKNFYTFKVDDPGLVQRLKAAGIKFSAVHESSFLKDIFSWIFPALFFIGIWFLIMNRMGPARGGGLLPVGKSRAKIYVEKGLKTRFEDVAGVDEAKNELLEIVNFLRNPTEYSKLGGRMPKGVLLVGPPGTGKTMLSRAVAGEANVPFFSINGSEFVELFVGLGAARVRDLFEQARTQAPCIVFIDELDALGKARGIAAVTGSGGDEKEQTLNQLLAEMDGFDPSIGIIVVAATNRPEVLDPALLRAGRFDRHILVDKPDRLGRIKILEIHLRKIKTAPSVDPSTIAGMTAGFSGADLANLVNEAALIATRRGARFVDIKDCTEAIERTMAGLERRSRVLSDNEKRRVAYHEMGHATVALAIGIGEAVHKVSIIPRGLAALGYTLRRPIEDRYLMSKRELEVKLAVAMGGRAAERLFFEDISTGAADDLDKATEIARAMVTRYGMSGALGLAIYEKERSPILGNLQAQHALDYSNETARAIDAEVKRILDHALTEATEVIGKFRAFLDRGAQALLSRETIEEEELKGLWNDYKGAAIQKIA